MPKIAFVGEAWGAWEAKAKRPLVGISGLELFNQLTESGIVTQTSDDRSNIRDFWHFWRIWRDNDRSDNLIQTKPMERIWDAHPEIFLTNVFNFQPKGNNIETLCVPKKESMSSLPPIKAGKYLAPCLEPELAKLQKTLFSLRPNLIVALGGTAAWALLRDPRITKLRGAIAACLPPFEGKVLPIYHPAHVIRPDAYKNRHVTIIDLFKAKREMEYPDIRRPARTVLIPESIDDLYTIRAMASDRGLSPDIETAGDQITCVGFGFDEKLAVCIPFVDPRRMGASYWGTPAEEKLAWEVVKELSGRECRKIFQNALFDVNRLWRSYGITFGGDIEDTMLMHHALQPESPKDLGFLGSVYTNEPAWKLMRARGRDNFKKEE